MFILRIISLLLMFNFTSALAQDNLAVFACENPATKTVVILEQTSVYDVNGVTPFPGVKFTSRLINEGPQVPFQVRVFKDQAIVGESDGDKISSAKLIMALGTDVQYAPTVDGLGEKGGRHISFVVPGSTTLIQLKRRNMSAKIALDGLLARDTYNCVQFTIEASQRADLDSCEDEDDECGADENNAELG